MTIHPETLKAARLRAGFSQEELARQCAVLGKPISKKAIYHYEKGKTQPSELRHGHETALCAGQAAIFCSVAASDAIPSCSARI